jgi:glyceraldehyde-3-phosphate dehydrogenase/erythrose-4-phosphate dehydrogenase
MGEKTIGSGRQGSVLSTYWVNKDECERRSTGQVGRETSSEEVNVAFERATEGDMKGILEYSDVPLVSQDIVGNPASCISDSQLTMSVGKTVKVLD